MNAFCDKPPRGWYCTRDAGHPGPCAAHPFPDGVYVVEFSIPPHRAGFEVIKGTIEHAARPLHDWLRKNPLQCIRVARRVADVGAQVDFPVGRPQSI
jgi:hypothetical protein